MRLIDADAFDVFDYTHTNDEFDEGVQFVLEKIDAAPTIDPVRHGRWLDIDGDGIVYQCDQCGGLSDRESAFCAGCGASMMDGGEE